MWTVAPVEGIRSAAHAEELNGVGYTRIDGFLSADEVRDCREALSAAIDLLDRPLGPHWFPTALLPEEHVRSAISTGLRPVIEPKLSTILEPDVLELVRFDCSVKPPAPESGLGPHQDFALIDEDRWTSLYVWIPLCDTDAGNGTLHVVPGSHHFSNRVRSQHVPAVFDEVLDLVDDAAVCLDCRAGDLILMVSGVIHFSPPNASDELRLAAHGIVTPIEAPLVFYYADDQTPDGQVECYEMEIDQYIRHIIAGRPGPEFASIGLIDRPEGSMTRDRFLEGTARYASRPTSVR
jgi:hypothetical protein